jgi:hypothetical protein
MEIAFHVLHHHNRIVHDDADRETSPNNRQFNEKPNAWSAANVPTSDTGIAMSGITDARHDWRKRTTTTTTRTAASKIVFCTSRTDSAMNSDGL